MRCQSLRCHYNDCGYCRQPDYASIGEDGLCEQRYVPKKTITERYEELSQIADEAYKTFDFNPTKLNSDAYGLAKNELEDFCVEVLDIITREHPEITDKIYWEP